MICTRCVLPDTFPGISFDERGVCSHCRKSEHKKAGTAGEKKRYEEKFAGLLAGLRGSGQLAHRPYDAIMAYSGGKDSTYTLKLLREVYGLRVLAITFDHGFMSPRAVDNIRAVTNALSVDHLMVSPARDVVWGAFAKSAGTELYPMKSLERASSVCNTCMNLAKSLIMRHAVEMGVPLVAYGWSPGQAPVQSSVLKLNKAMVQGMQEALDAALRGVLGDALTPFMLGERHYRLFDMEYEAFGGSFLYNLHPLAFLEYSEEAIVRDIQRLGWEMPRDTDANSTNCLLNAFANEAHIRKYGFHPYALEIAGLVREGCMTREAGLGKLSEPADAQVIRFVKDRLGVA